MHLGKKLRALVGLHRLPPQLSAKRLKTFHKRRKRKPYVFQYKGREVRVLECRWDRRSFRLGRKFLASFPKTDFKSFVVRIDPGTFESPVAIRISYKWGTDHKRQVAEAALNFAKIEGYGKSVLIESLSGEENVRKQLARFHREAKMPWDGFLTKKGIEHAKACGLEAIGIIDPESMYWYHDPSISYTSRDTKEAIQKRMRKRYMGIAAEHGFDTEHPVSIKHGIYYMLKL